MYPSNVNLVAIIDLALSSFDYDIILAQEKHLIDGLGKLNGVTEHNIVSGNAEGAVNSINAPFKIHPDYPQMLAQNYLDPETQFAVAQYLLNIPLGQSQP